MVESSPGLTVQLPSETQAEARQETLADSRNSSAPQSARAYERKAKPPVVGKAQSAPSLLQPRPGLIRIHSRVFHEPEESLRSPLGQVIARLPCPVNVSVDALTTIPQTPDTPRTAASRLLSPRRRLSVTFVRRQGIGVRHQATRTTVSVDLGLVQIVLLVIFFGTCSSFGINAVRIALGGGVSHPTAVATRAAIAASRVDGLTDATSLSLATRGGMVRRWPAGEDRLEGAERAASQLADALRCATQHAQMVARARSLWAAPSRARRSVLRAVLAAEHRIRLAEKTEVGGSALLAACLCATNLLCESSCALLYPVRWHATRHWHALTAADASRELAIAERRLKEALPLALAAQQETTPNGAPAADAIGLALARRAGEVPLHASKGAVGSADSSRNVLALRTLPYATVQSRLKSARSTFEKAALRGKVVNDLMALRVIIEPTTAGEAAEAECIAQCERVHALVHAVWPGSVVATKDYMVAPKPNGYQSTHLLLRLPSGRHLEVQIRTRCQHIQSEYGTASHAAYKAAGLQP